MSENCVVCNSLIQEITIYNGETRNFCSFECVQTDELIQAFRNYLDSFCKKYKYVHREDVLNFLHPSISKKMKKGLIGEVIRRNYFMTKDGFIYPIGKIINLTRYKNPF